jgi:hypothetical protein
MAIAVGLVSGNRNQNINLCVGGCYIVNGRLLGLLVCMVVLPLPAPALAWGDMGPPDHLRDRPPGARAGSARKDGPESRRNFDAKCSI